MFSMFRGNSWVCVVGIDEDETDGNVLQVYRVVYEDTYMRMDILNR